MTGVVALAALVGLIACVFHYLGGWATFTIACALALALAVTKDES